MLSPAMCRDVIYSLSLSTLDIVCFFFFNSHSNGFGVFLITNNRYLFICFSGGTVVKNPSANAGDAGLSLGSGRSSREGNGYPFWCFCLENSMDRGAWWAIVCGVTRIRHHSVTEHTHVHYSFVCFLS